MSRSSLLPSLACCCLLLLSSIQVSYSEPNDNNTPIRLDNNENRKNNNGNNNKNNQNNNGKIRKPNEPTKDVRVVGGRTVTNQTAYPYLGFPMGPNNCAATLFHDDLLITSANCKGFFLKGLFLGGITIDGKSGSRPLKVAAEYVHPNFNVATMQNDIMIIKLAEPLKDVPKVQLNIDNQAVPKDNDGVNGIGFGALNENGTYSETLQKVRFIVAPPDRCTMYSRYKSASMICTWFPAGGRDTCNGDSGGPILMDNTNIQVAIVSFGEGCARKGVPSVNTRVSYYSDFIKRSICQYSSVRPASCPNGGASSDSKSGASLSSSQESYYSGTTTSTTTIKDDKKNSGSEQQQSNPITVPTKPSAPGIQKAPVSAPKQKKAPKKPAVASTPRKPSPTTPTAPTSKTVKSTENKDILNPLLQPPKSNVVNPLLVPP